MDKRRKVKNMVKKKANGNGYGVYSDYCTVLYGTPTRYFTALHVLEIRESDRGHDLTVTVTIKTATARRSPTATTHVHVEGDEN
jgi:hypothetical protein